MPHCVFQFTLSSETIENKCPLKAVLVQGQFAIFINDKFAFYLSFHCAFNKIMLVELWAGPLNN